MTSIGFCTALITYAPSEMISSHYESISRILINFQARAESRYPITDVHRSGQATFFSISFPRPIYNINFDPDKNTTGRIYLHCVSYYYRPPNKKTCSKMSFHSFDMESLSEKQFVKNSPL